MPTAGDRTNPVPLYLTKPVRTALLRLEHKFINRKIFVLSYRISSGEIWGRLVL